MSIAFYEAAIAGNAVKLTISPSDKATSIRVLRKTVDSFSDENDPAATVVLNELATACIDTDQLVNGTNYYYLDFELISGSWVAGKSVLVVPASAYIDESVDIVSMLLDRIQLGVDEEILAERIKPSSKTIKVVNSPPLFDNVSWPIVGIHLDSESPHTRSIGENYDFDTEISNGVDERRGFYSESNVSIVAWSANPDQRILMRNIIRRILIANSEVFSMRFGVSLPEATFRDDEDFQSWSIPVYMSHCSFRCIAQSGVKSTTGKVADVLSVPTVTNGVLNDEIYQGQSRRC